jgi:hypothetical protein
MCYTLFMYKSVRSQRHAEKQNDVPIKFLMSLEHNNNIFNKNMLRNHNTGGTISQA